MKKRARKLTALILAGVLTAAMLGGCGSSDSSDTTSDDTEDTTEEVAEEAEEEASSGQAEVDTSRTTTDDSDEKYEKIVVALSQDPTDLEPIQMTSTSKPYFYWSVYECLFDFEDGDYVPALAESYTIVDDLHYDVTIRDCIYDSDGNHITADDVVYSYEWMISTGETSQMEAYESIEKVDDYTVRFTWAEGTDATGVAVLEGPFCRVAIFSQTAFEEHNFATDPVATGPYIITEFTSGSKLILEARDDYWASDEILATMTRTHQANVQTIEYDIITEAAQQVIALQTGSIDFAIGVSDENISDFQEGGSYSENYNAFAIQSNLYYRLETNLSEDSLLSDENLRLAIFYALDNEAIATAVGALEPAYAVASDWYSDYCYEWEEMETYINTYDVELAKEYLEKSDYNGETLILCGNNSDQIKNIMVFIQALLTNIGINVEVEATESSITIEKRHSTDTWDMSVISTGGSTIIGSYNSYLNNKKSDNGLTSQFLEDDTLQEMYELCKTIDGHTDENMTALYEYCLENAYIYTIGSITSNTVYSTDIAEIYYREGEYETMGGSTFYLD